MQINVASGLREIGVLVTRPHAQADSLIVRIEAHGGRAFRMPVLEIADVPESSHLAELYDHLPEFDMAIFVSANAVRKTIERVLTARPWPDEIQVAAVGPSTEQELAANTIEVQIRPQHQFDSEGLLAMEQLHNVQGKRIVIFRGEGGRSLLGNTLRERGAVVEYGALYRRGIPDTDVNPVLQQFETGDIDIITVSSLESLRNLDQMFGDPGRPWLCKTPIIVVNQKMKDYIEMVGGGANVLQAENATDEAVVDRILAWVRAR